MASENVTYNNSGVVTVDIDAASNGGLNIIGGTGTGGALYVDPNLATVATSLDPANDYVLIYDQGVNATRKIVPQKFADLPSSFSLSAGTGLNLFSWLVF